MEAAPINFNKGMQSVHKELWTKAMAPEYDGLLPNETFETVNVP